MLSNPFATSIVDLLFSCLEAVPAGPLLGYPVLVMFLCPCSATVVSIPVVGSVSVVVLATIRYGGLHHGIALAVLVL